MKSTHVYILAGVFAVLVLAVLLLEGPFKPEPAEKPKSEAILADFKPADVVKIELSEKDKKVVLDKSGSQWVVQTSEGYPANQKKVDESLEKLKSLEKAEIVSTNPDNHAAMEVDDENGTLLKLFGANDTLTAEVIIGKARDWASTYARKKGSNNTVIAQQGLHNAFTAESKDWLNKELLKFERKSLSKVTVKSESQEFSIEQPEENKWKITSPMELPCSENTASSIAGTLSNLSLTDVAPKKDLAEYGLDKPQHSITVEVADTAPRTIHIGRKKDDAEEFYAKRDDSESIILITKDAVNAVARKLEDVVDKTVLKFEPDELTKTTLTTRGQEISLERDQVQGWVMKSPFNTPAETSTVDYVVKTLSYLSAANVVISPDPAQTGLESPTTTIALSFKDETKNKKLLVGILKDDANYHARIENANVTYLISKHFIEGISQKAVADFVSRDISRFDVNQVTALTLNYPQNSVALHKEGALWKFGQAVQEEKKPTGPESPPEGEKPDSATGENDAPPAPPASSDEPKEPPAAPEAQPPTREQPPTEPQPSAPAEPEVNASIVTDVLATLSTLRATNISDVTDPAQCGFDAPALRVTITLTYGETIDLTFGKMRDDGSWFVKRSDREIVYLVADPTVQKLLLAPETFVKTEPPRIEEPPETPEPPPVEEKEEPQETEEQKTKEDPADSQSNKPEEPSKPAPPADAGSEKKHENQGGVNPPP